MDKPNKNIEDFFNKSLEQFNEAPSNSVWQGIDQQLDFEDQKPSYKKWLFWMSSLLGVLLLCTLSWGYSTIQQKIDLLGLKTTQLEKENEQLKLALNDCSTATTPTVSENSKEKDADNSVLTQTENFSNKPNKRTLSEITKNNSVSNNNPFSFLQNNPIVDLSFGDFSGIKKQLDVSSSNVFSSSDGFTSQTFYSKNRQSFSAMNILEKIVNRDRASKITKVPTTAAEIAQLKESRIQDLIQIKQIPVVSNLLKSRDRGLLANTFIRKVPIKFKKPKDKSIDYRSGVGFGMQNTNPDQDDGFGMGFNIGFTNELKLFKKVYLTGALNFNESNYRVQMTAADQSLVQEYPGTEFVTNPITQIKQEAHYFGIPLGLKWYFKDNEKNKFYVNPSVAWQFYLPQKFTYEFSPVAGGTNQLEYESERFFGYLGSAQLHLGLEKPFINKMKYQVGLWAEKSIVPLGVEDRDILNIGLRGAVLFK